MQPPADPGVPPTSHFSRRLSPLCVAEELGVQPRPAGRPRKEAAGQAPPRFPPSPRASVYRRPEGALVTGEEPRASRLRLLVVTASRNPPHLCPPRASESRAAATVPGPPAVARLTGPPGRPLGPAPASSAPGIPPRCHSAAWQVCLGHSPHVVVDASRQDRTFHFCKLHAAVVRISYPYPDSLQPLDFVLLRAAGSRSGK